MSSEHPPREPADTADAHHDEHLRSGDAGTVAATGGALRLQTRFVAMALTMGSTVLLVRYLGDDEFGDLSLIIALVTIVTGITDLGLSAVGLREWIRRSPERRRTLLADLLGLRLVTIGIGSVVAVAFAFAVGYPSDVVLGLVAALVGTAFNAIQGALTIPLIAELRQAIVGVLELIAITVQVAVQVVLVLVGAGVVPIAAAFIPAGMAGFLAVLLALRDRPPWPRFHFRALFGLLRESVAFAAAGAVSVVYIRAAVLLGPAFLTAKEFGAFAVAFRAVESLTMLPSLLTGALFPVLTHAALHDRPRLARGYDSLWRSTTTLGAFAAAGVIGVAPLITLVFTGTRDAVTVDTFVLLGCGLGAIFVGAAGMWMLLAERNYRAVLTINLVALTCNVALTVVAGVWLGPGWFAIGIVVAEIGIALATDWVSRRGLARSGHPIPGRPAVHLAKVGGAVAAALVAFALTRDLFPLIPLAAACGAAGAVLLLTRAVPAELRTLVADIVRRLTGRAPQAV